MRLHPRLVRSSTPGVSLLLSALALALLAPGCEEPRHVRTKNNKTPAATAPAAEPTAEAAAPAPGAEPAAPAAPEVVQPREILNKRTQEVRNMDVELQKGAQLGTTKITAKDPITLPGNAYVTTVGRTAILQVEHALNLYNAANGSYPKTYDEFYAEIIKANNIALPQLPYYQEYGYNAAEHKLVILEYPDRKAAAK